MDRRALTIRAYNDHAYSCKKLLAARHVGEVPMVDALLGFRSVSGFFGIAGTGFFVGDVDRAVLGLAGPDVGADVEDFWDPSCSHCFRRSATLPVLLVPFVSAGGGSKRAPVVVLGLSCWRDAAGKVGFLTGIDGGWVF